MVLRQRFQLGHAHVLDQQMPPRAAKRSSHTGIFRRWSGLGRAVQRRGPVDLGAGLFRMRHGEADALDRRTGIVPFVDAQVALDPQRRVEMHWLDMTWPARTSSGLRLVATVTS